MLIFYFSDKLNDLVLLCGFKKVICFLRDIKHVVMMGEIVTEIENRMVEYMHCHKAEKSSAFLIKSTQ